MEEKVLYRDGDITYLLVLNSTGEYVLRTANKKTGATSEEVIRISG